MLKLTRIFPKVPNISTLIVVTYNIPLKVIVIIHQNHIHMVVLCSSWKCMFHRIYMSFKLIFVFMIFQNLLLFSASQWYLRNSLILSNQNASQINNAHSHDMFEMSGVSVVLVFNLSVYYGSIFDTQYS